VCEQLAQSRYMAVHRPRVEPATSRLPVWHATVTPPSRTSVHTESQNYTQFYAFSDITVHKYLPQIQDYKRMQFCCYCLTGDMAFSNLKSFPGVIQSRLGRFTHLARIIPIIPSLVSVGASTQARIKYLTEIYRNLQQRFPRITNSEIES